MEKEGAKAAATQGPGSSPPTKSARSNGGGAGGGGGGAAAAASKSPARSPKNVHSPKMHHKKHDVEEVRRGGVVRWRDSQVHPLGLAHDSPSPLGVCTVVVNASLTYRVPRFPS